MENNNKSSSKLKKVMIGTPTYDGRLDVHYVDSLNQTIQLGNQLEVYKLFLFSLLMILYFNVQEMIYFVWHMNLK
jgi:hypothetical protein